MRMPATLATLEHQKAALIAELAALPPAQRAYRPAPGQWSAVEVLDHLVRVEREILVAARRGVASPQRRGLRDRVGVALLDWLFRSDRRVRVPTSVPQVLPAAGADFATVCGEWGVARAELADFLAALSPQQLGGGIFRHPVAGWMNVGQVLRFFWVHTHHHRFQLDRLRAAARQGDLA